MYEFTNNGRKLTNTVNSLYRSYDLKGSGEMRWFERFGALGGREEASPSWILMTQPPPTGPISKWGEGFSIWILGGTQFSPQHTGREGGIQITGVEEDKKMYSYWLLE